jgi:hypothetical protein
VYIDPILLPPLGVTFPPGGASVIFDKPSSVDLPPGRADVFLESSDTDVVFERREKLVKV